MLLSISGKPNPFPAIRRVFSFYMVGIVILGLAELTFALKKSPPIMAGLET